MLRLNQRILCGQAAVTNIYLAIARLPLFERRMRTTRDQAVIRLGLSLFRNLVAIPDTESSITGTMEQFISSIMQVPDQQPPLFYVQKQTMDLKLPLTMFLDGNENIH